MKTKVLIILIVLIILFLLSVKIKQGYIRFTELNMCFDIGICKEGIVIGAGSDNSIRINKESCLKHDWKWDEERSWCNMRYKPEN
ncbi:MAG: hypothetical protein LBJ74_02695 [Heliobacteriaceae bacterium]|jgi:hypothetical protein|nr:hypothetical protein [Heliobacteriaceae bacterium]